MQEVRVYFGGQIANLYDIGYLSTDLYQLIAFSELIDQKEDKDIERWFGDKSRPFNRYASVLDKYRKSSEISEARGGSLEIVVQVAALISSIVIPLVAVYIQLQNSHAVNNSVSFEISVKDPRLQHLLELFREGHFGRGAEAIDSLFQALKERGYDVELRSGDAFVIHDTLQKYSQRMVRTMQRP